MEYYVLQGHVAVPVASAFEYSRWRIANSDAYRVALSTVGELSISTVFLGLNHACHDPRKPPEIFETMIFGEPYDNWCWRSGTWDEAEVIHAGVVADLQAGRAPKLEMIGNDD